MLSILIPYRNRDTVHVQNCLKSLQQQNDMDFEVHFIDYGSKENFAERSRELCGQYGFVNYIYHPVKDQPWNKSRALNTVIKNLKSQFCFVADVDMIFHKQFVEKAKQLNDISKCVYFQVGFLNPGEEVTNKSFDNFAGFRKSTSEATGLSIFPVKTLKELRGFDEFYHFWGAEDTDIHIRMKNAGYDVEFYEENILMLHQWHTTYRLKETSKLTSELQVGGIVQLNHKYLQNAILEKRIRVNKAQWGEIPSVAVMSKLANADVDQELTNEKSEIDEFLYGRLPQLKKGIFKIKVKETKLPLDWKYGLKKILNRKTPTFYSLKEVNDLLLLHLISFYRENAYSYKILDNAKAIELAIFVE